jgi:hypothetical protein
MELQIHVSYTSSPLVVKTQNGLFNDALWTTDVTSSEKWQHPPLFCSQTPSISVFPYSDKPSFTPKQDVRQNYICAYFNVSIFREGGKRIIKDSEPNFNNNLMNLLRSDIILICCCHYQTLQLCNNLKIFISYIYITILFCVMVRVIWKCT